MLMLVRSAAALAAMSPVLLLRVLKKAARIGTEVCVVARAHPQKSQVLIGSSDVMQ